MSGSITFFEILLQRLRFPPAYDPREMEAPAAILWPDKGREWESLLPRLREHLPILTWRSYEPTQRSGPAIWLRCMLARTLEDRLSPNVIPVIYLPGVSADELCHVWERPTELDPLVELYYRGELFVNQEGQDWTIAEFFQNQGGGLGVEARVDDYTRKAMRRALPMLCDLTLDQLREEEPWKAKDFEGLLEKSIKILITLDESAELEFKSTARWDVRQCKKNNAMEKVIVKSVAGMLNSHLGGNLLIGVEDSKNVCGIELDYQTFSEARRNPDAYERWLIGLLLNALGQEFAPSIKISFYDVDGRTVCKVRVDPAPRPAIVTDKDQDIFYLRTGNGTDPIGLRAVLPYYDTRWRSS